MARAGKKREGRDLVEQIREAVRNSGQSLYEISKSSGVAASQLSRFMRGERTLTLPAASKVCDALHLHLQLNPADVREGPPAAAPAKKPRRKKGE